MTPNNENEKNDSYVEDTSIRQNMVTTALNFLLNPDVINKSEHSKIGFLRKKGLNEAEISAAFDLAKQNPRYYSSPTSSGPSLQSEPRPYLSEKYSFWARLSHFSSSLIVVAVALYGLQRFYKLYLEPWLFGKKSEKELSVLEAQLMELNNSMIQVKNAVSSLEKKFLNQSEQVERTFLTESTVYKPIPMEIADLKTEISSVKSLLINRHQFPAPPKVANNPSIPHWQLAESKSESTGEEVAEAAADGEASEDVPQTPEAKGDSFDTFHTPEEETVPLKPTQGKGKGKVKGKKTSDSSKPVSNGVNGLHSNDN